MIQWGSVTTSNTYVDFPIPFVTACCAMVANNNRDGSYVDACTCYFNKAQYKVRQNDHNATSTWVAIGY